MIERSIIPSRDLIIPEAWRRNVKKRAVKSYYGPSIELPRGHQRSNLRKPYCKEPYDEVHIKKWGYGCLNKHRTYNWPPMGEENYLLIGDSIVKHVNKTKHMRVISYPGATASTIIRKISNWEIYPDLYKIIIVAVGTNETSNLQYPIQEILVDVMNLLDTIRDTNPSAMITYSGMLIRPKDQGTQIEHRRQLLNKKIEGECKARGMYFARSWKSLLNGLILKDRVYARDGLHLNRFGARFLYRFYEGTLKNIEGIMKL